MILVNQSQSLDHWEPVGHLQGMAAELCLKSFLEFRGESHDRLLKNDVRHDLTQLFELSLEKSLSMSETVATAICNMTPAHKSYFFRYGPSNIDVSKDAHSILLCDQFSAHVANAILIDHVSGLDQCIPLVKEVSFLRATHDAFKNDTQPVTLQRWSEVRTAREVQASKIAALTLEP